MIVYNGSKLPTVGEVCCLPLPCPCEWTESDARDAITRSRVAVVRLRGRNIECHLNTGNAELRTEYTVQLHTYRLTQPSTQCGMVTTVMSFRCVGCNTSAQCILDGVPRDECDGLIFAAAAMFPYATITVESCHDDFCTKFSCIISHAVLQPIVKYFVKNL